jgi:hypothetical protein
MKTRRPPFQRGSFLKARNGRLGVDEEELQAAHVAKSASGSVPMARLRTVWWEPPAMSHASVAVEKFTRCMETTEN